MPKLKRTRFRSKIRAKINSNKVYYNTGDNYSRQLIQEHLVHYLGEAEPPIPYEQEYIDYLDIECGNQPRSIEAYLIDLRVFFATNATSNTVKVPWTRAASTMSRSGNS